MGMVRSGTTLMAEMIHKGGTPMFAGDLDPRYDGGLRYERVSTHKMNLSILGLERGIAGIRIIGLPIGDPPSAAQLEELSCEVGEAPWGFKDPRTTLTYPAWCEVFSGGSRAYIYRGHQEVVRHYFRSGKNLRRSLKTARMGLLAWLHFNERILENLSRDRAAGRPHALVSYEELMNQPALLAPLENALEVPLADARNWDLRRNTLGNAERQLYGLICAGQGKRIAKLYEQLEASRLVAASTASNESSAA